MGFITNDTSNFSYGDTLQNVYAYITDILYSVSNNSWQVSVKYYLSIKSREKEKVYDYYRNISILSQDSAGIEYRDRPEYYSEKQWSYIISKSRAFITPIYKYGFSINNGVAQPKSLSISDIKEEMYKHIIEQCEPNAVSVLEDEDIETLVQKDLKENVK